MKRVLGWIAVIVLLGGIGAGGFYGIIRLVEEQEEDEPVEKPAMITAVIERGDVVEVETLEGRLRYQEPAVIYVATGGVVTWLPEEGASVGRGEPVLEVDGTPVILLYGERPAWRSLSDDVDDGPDVEQLERNLAELGFDPDEQMDVDTEFTEETTTAVEAWQAEMGLPENGTIELGRIIFTAGPVRIGSLQTQVGATVGPGSPAFEISGTAQEIVVMLDIEQQDLVAQGDQVAIILPDESEATGTITAISNVTVTDRLTGKQTLEMTIAFDRPADSGAFEQAVVDVEVISEQVLDVLLVPVEAVVALAEGGYALELVEGEETRLVAVELGKFADGLVEVSGEVQEGDLVTVPR